MSARIVPMFLKKFIGIKLRLSGLFMDRLYASMYRYTSVLTDEHSFDVG